MRFFIPLVLFLSLSFPVISDNKAKDQLLFSDSLNEKIDNYHRLRPQLATSGILKPGAIAELKRIGFKTIIDLRTAKEGTADEAKIAKQTGLIHYNLEVGKSFPSAATMNEFKLLLEHEANYPMIVHCVSANRVGMLWGAYLLNEGLSYEDALAEARTIGMSAGREAQLKQYHDKLNAGLDYRSRYEDR